MERATSLKKSAGRLALLAALGGLCGVVYSCASTRPAAKVGEPTPPQQASLRKESAAPGAVAVPEALSLEGFRPLLADARYEAARLKQEAGDYGAAAELARAAQLTNPPPAAELDRHRFLLGRLFERAGRFAEARAAFETVSPASLLAPYAELGAARMELALGSADRALAHLGRAGVG